MGVNLNSHEHNHTKNKKYASSLKMMACDSFAFFVVTFVNELENQAINRSTIHGLVGKVAGHLRRMKFKNKGKCLEKVYLVFFCLRKVRKLTKNAEEAKNTIQAVFDPSFFLTMLGGAVGNPASTNN